jgi:ubiquinol-cytochrome c reductase iron-sulfur subunit
MLGMVGGVFGIAIAFPLASLGDRPHTDLDQTPWKAGTPVVNFDGQQIKPGFIEPDGILTVFPGIADSTGALTADTSDSLSAVLLINVGSANIEVPPSRQGWIVDDVVAFSKICTHAGCPVSLYDVLSHQLICPCHQSTFDVLSDCKPVFGPASRSLPQLPLTTDEHGYLIAQAPFDQAVGPGFWNRG